MRVILTDWTDHPTPKLRGMVLRVLDDSNVLVFHGNVYGHGGRQCCERIATGLGVALEYVGRPVRVLTSAPSETVSTVDSPSDYVVANVAQQGMLF